MLTWRSQRRLSKAIRRAKMMGALPSYYRNTASRRLLSPIY
jgi:hypothetical protein